MLNDKDTEKPENKKWLAKELGLPCWFVEYVQFINAKRFRWNEIPGEDTWRLIEFLEQEFVIKGLEKAKIEKIEENTIKVTYGEKSFITLKLINDKMSLQIEGPNGIYKDENHKYVSEKINENTIIYANGKWKSRKIWINHGEINYLLESPAEKRYIEAYYEDERAEIELQTNIQVDYGILARITKDANQYFVIAGIHQYGTWIVGSLLSEFLGARNDFGYKSALLSDVDFIAIIWGMFDFNKLTVDNNNMGILMNNIWTRTKETGEWVRAEPDKPVTK